MPSKPALFAALFLVAFASAQSGTATTTTFGANSKKAPPSPPRALEICPTEEDCPTWRTCKACPGKVICRAAATCVLDMSTTGATVRTGYRGCEAPVLPGVRHACKTNADCGPTAFLDMSYGTAGKCVIGAGTPLSPPPPLLPPPSSPPSDSPLVPIIIGVAAFVLVVSICGLMLYLKKKNSAPKVAPPA